MTAQLRPDAVTAQTFDLTNPATGELVGSYPVHSAEDVAGVVAAARAAQVWWVELGYAGRKQ